MSAAPILRAACLVAGVLSLHVGFADAQDAPSPNPMKALDKATLDAFVQKPLFDPARQLPPPPPVAFNAAPPPPPPPEPPPNLQLLGVVHGSRDMAIVHRDGNEKTVVLRSGDKLGSWTVVVRPPVTVTLRNGDRKVDFAIFAKSVPGVTTARAMMPARRFVPGGRRRAREDE